MHRQFQINREMLQNARRQFCLDTCLDWQQYLAQPEKKCFIQKTQYMTGTNYPAGDGARLYNGTTAFFKAIMCMGQLFLAVDEKIYDWAVEKFADYPPEWFCEYGNLRMIDAKLQEYGQKIKDTHVYFLPAEKELAEVRDVSKSFEWYNQEEILRFKENNRFTSAICFSPTQPDMLAVAALRDTMCPEKEFDQANMAGMAGVSADGEYLWQIGINVVQEYTGRGLAVNLVRQIKEEIIRRGKVPFYGTSESHTVSQSIAIKAGFLPAWTEIYVKSIEN